LTEKKEGDKIIARERKMMKRIAGSNKREEVIDERRNSLWRRGFLFSFINSIILSGVLFISCIYIFISPYFNSPLFKKEGWGDLKSIPSGVAQRNSVDPTGEPTFPL